SRRERIGSARRKTIARRGTQTSPLRNRSGTRGSNPRHPAWENELGRFCPVTAVSDFEKLLPTAFPERSTRFAPSGEFSGEGQSTLPTTRFAPATASLAVEPSRRTRRA